MGGGCRVICQRGLPSLGPDCGFRCIAMDNSRPCRELLQGVGDALTGMAHSQLKKTGGTVIGQVKSPNPRVKLKPGEKVD